MLDIVPMGRARGDVKFLTDAGLPPDPCHILSTDRRVIAVVEEKLMCLEDGGTVEGAPRAYEAFVTNPIAGLNELVRGYSV